MIKWLKNLFETKQEVVVKTRKKYTRLSSEDRKNLVVDRTINKMSYKELVEKYYISEAAVYQILKKSNALRRL